MARLVIATLVLLASAQVYAQYGHGPGANQPVSVTQSKGALNSAGNKFYITGATGQELKGVWQVEGSKESSAAAQAADDLAMPDCSTDTLLPSFVGLDYEASQFIVLAGPPNITNLMYVTESRTTFSNGTYNYPFILTTGSTGLRGCSHFQPYVDMETGDLMAENLLITLWTRNTSAGASGRPIRSWPSCTITGREQVGCYTGAIATGPAIQMAPASAPTVAISSISNISPASNDPNRPEGSIATVSKTTYRCRQGDCIKLSPKHQTTHPVYGG